MEELKDASIHHTAQKLTSRIKTMKGYEDVVQMVQKLVCNPNVDKHSMRTTLENAIKEAGLETEIRNIVFRLLRSTMKPALITPNDPLAFLRRAGVQWDRRVRKSLNAMCNELKIPLHGQPRTVLDREALFSKWEELSNYAIDLSSIRPVYAPKDLLEVLMLLKGPPLKTNESDEPMPKWEFAHISMPSKNLAELRIHYADLLRHESYGPINNATGCAVVNCTDIAIQCQRVLESRHATLCQHMLKHGNTLPPYRGALWGFVLGNYPLSKIDMEHWYKLRGYVLSTDHIVDKLVFKDIQLTASNDDQYFVFEDVLYQVMLCFSRDTDIADFIQFENFPVKGKHYEGPPSGVVPFHGICMFAAPFCYLYDSPIHLYFNFRAFYIRYCHRLTTINTHKQGIVSLCLLFERLLQTHEPELWSHFRDIHIQPIRVVFKWLMRAFSGHLPPDQLLILWDLILGFDNLDMLPFLAIVILSFRKESILQVTSLDSIEAILADLSSIKVLPLIQLGLSND